MKRILPALLGLFAVSAVAAETPNSFLAAEDETITAEELRLTGEQSAGPALNLYRADIFRGADGATLIHGLPVLVLLDGRRLYSSELGRMGTAPLDVVPLALLTAVQVKKNASPVYGSEAPDGVIDLRTRGLETGGEIGFRYGKSTGKYGGEAMQAYFIGTVGNDKFQITAGAAYEESSFRYRRTVR